MCDTLCALGRGGTLFAKNSDRPIDEAQILDLVAARPAGPRLATQYLTIPDAGANAAVVTSRPGWLWGAEHGVNASGLAVGNEKIFTTDDPHSAPPALIGMDLVRLALERARSAGEAVEVIAELLATHGQGGSGEESGTEPYWSSFLAADPTGAWVMETSQASWVASPVVRSAAISNVVSLRSEWTRSSPDVSPGADWDRWRDPAVPTGIADHRRAVTSATAGQLGADLAEGPGAAARRAVAALRHHGTVPWGEPASPAAVGSADPEPVPADVFEDFSGVTVCMHVRDYQATTASMLAWLPEDPDEPIRLWASLGSPCASAVLPGVLWRSGEPAVSVAPVLGDESVWDLCRRLARRVEAPGQEGLEALRSVRAALGPLEADAWDEADELFASAASRSAWDDATRRWSEEFARAVGVAVAVTGA